MPKRAYTQTMVAKIAVIEMSSVEERILFVWAKTLFMLSEMVCITVSILRLARNASSHVAFRSWVFKIQAIGGY